MLLLLLFSFIHCLFSCRDKVTHNVLELCLVRFETFSCRNITDKDTMFVAICKAKIIVFRGATAFANALLSARIRQRCCYLQLFSFIALSPILALSILVVSRFSTQGFIMSYAPYNCFLFWSN